MRIQNPAVSPGIASDLTASTRAKDTPERIQKGATDFEALLLTQILRSARQSAGATFSGDDSDDSGTNSSLLDLGEQQFAQALSASGGLGLAKMVMSGLNHAD